MKTLREIAPIVATAVFFIFPQLHFSGEATWAAEALTPTGQKAGSGDSLTLSREEFRVFQEHVSARVGSKFVAKKDAVNDCKPIFAVCSVAAAGACIFACLPTDPLNVLLGTHQWSDSCDSCVDEIASQCIADSGC